MTENFIKSCQLQELTEQESRNCSGGFWLKLAQKAAFACVGAILEDWDNFKRGLAWRSEL